MIEKERFEEIVVNSFSIRQVLLAIGLKPVGGNYRTFKNKIKKYEIDISHFTGQGYLKNKNHNWSKKIPIEKILVKNSSYSCSNNLKKRLIKEGFFEKKCNACGLTCWKSRLTNWMEKEIPLEIEHINGDNTDNRIENLELLCPNCHAQTSTYRGKNIVKKQKSFKKTKKEKIIKKKFYCNNCNCEITGSGKSSLCIKCYHKNNRKVERPGKEQLEIDIKSMPILQIGKKYNVSDNAIRKWLFNYKLFKYLTEKYVKRMTM